MLVQEGDGRRGQHARASAVSALGCLENQSGAGRFFRRLLNPQMTGIEVDILPPQGQKLAPAHSAVERLHDERIERGAAQRSKYRLHLCWRKDINLKQFQARCVNYGGDITRDDAPLSRMLEHY